MTMTSMSPAADTRESDSALARAALYRALTLAFQPPSGAQTEALTSPTSTQVLDTAVGIVDPDGASNLADDVRRVRETLPPLAKRMREHTTLFGHTARGEVPPYETEYGTGEIFRQAQELADLSGFLGAFGLQVMSDNHERVDHVSCECEFMEVLALREAACLERGDREQAVLTREAMRSFLRDHLGWFGRGFGKRLEKATPDSWYGTVGALLACLIEVECEREGIPLGPPFLELRPTDSSDAPMVCGTEGCGAPGSCELDGGLKKHAGSHDAPDRDRRSA